MRAVPETILTWETSMSRKLLTVAALAVLAVSVVPSAGQAQTKFGVAAGLSAPTADFGKGFDAGYHVMASLAVMPPLAPLGFRVDGMFNEFNAKSPSTVKERILAATGN